MNRDIIKNSALFRNVSDGTLDRLAQAAREITAEKGQDIVKDGETGDCMYLLKSGTVSVTKKLTMLEDHDLDVKDKELRHLSAEDNAFFGEMVICSGSDKRSATVSAVTDCGLLELSSGDINTILEGDPVSAASFYKNLSIMLAGRLRRSNSDVLKLTTALSLALDE